VLGALDMRVMPLHPSMGQATGQVATMSDSTSLVMECMVDHLQVCMCAQQQLSACGTCLPVLHTLCSGREVWG
jgi:hypothetical protein